MQLALRKIMNRCKTDDSWQDFAFFYDKCYLTADYRLHCAKTDEIYWPMLQTSWRVTKSIFLFDNVKADFHSVALRVVA